VILLLFKLYQALKCARLGCKMGVWCGVWVVFVSVCFCRQLMLQWANSFIELRFNFPTSYFIFNFGF
jgi:hypothetical protein